MAKKATALFPLDQDNLDAKETLKFYYTYMYVVSVP